MSPGRSAAPKTLLVDTFNQRLGDAVLLRVAQPEPVEMGLGGFVRFPGA